MKMEETIIFPSPNWFQTSVLAVTPDGWLIYGGPSKSLCLLEPLTPSNQGIILSKQRFKAHFIHRAHPEKILSVDVSPSWPEKKNVLTGSADGSVKQWNIEESDRTVLIKSKHSHSTHFNDKEEVVGVGYSDETFAITVGAFGNIVKWDLTSNVVKVYNTFLKSYKPCSLACSRHIQLNVAIGTKQGVVFLIDLNGQGKIIYKVRAQDDEIVNLAWCPQYEVVLRKSLKESDKRPSASNKVDKIKNIESDPENINKSGIAKDLPEDSFDETIVQEDDMFDIYADHEADEFGHKKFEPEDVLVKIKNEKEPEDFLSECNKLKEEILKRKNEPEQSIQSLVDAFDKTHVHNENNTTNEIPKSSMSNGCESSVHIQKHLLATIGKHGAIRIWSKSGKLVASCAVSPGNRNKKNSGPICVNLLWYKPDVLLIADGKNQLLECNPLKIDCKNKLEWQVVHNVHRRGFYGISTNAPRLQVAGQPDDSDKDWLVWTIAQDRNFVCYSMKEKKIIDIYNTSGGFLYDVQSCPYDARKVAIAIGDGAVRVWESEIADDDEKLVYGKVSSYWQNVQGKVLTVAWHPTRENILAFATGEARVGVIDISGKTEKPAKTLLQALRAGVYSLCWGEGNELYACGGEELVIYQVDKPDQEPVPLKVEFEGQSWALSAVSWYPRALFCGSSSGAVAVLTPDTRQVVTAIHVFSKMIHSIQMHPEQTSNSNEVSPYKNLIAVSSLDRQHNVLILEYKCDGEKPTLQVWKTLVGHKAVVLQLAWSPHNDGQLFSTSQDGTVRVWDISDGSCTAIFGGHIQHAIGAAWSAEPARAHVIMSGGADCALRAWDLREHPPHLQAEVKHEVTTRRDRKRFKIKKEHEKDSKTEEVCQEEDIEETNHIAATSVKTKVPKKFLLPIINKQSAYCNVQSIRKLWKKLMKNEDVEDNPDVDDIDTDFLKIFGSTNDLNEILDLEMENHLENKRGEAWTMLAIFRGRIMDMIDFNAKRDKLCPFLVSLTPGVSPKYWKDVVGLYMAQMDRLAATEETDKTLARNYGGSPYRRAALQLSVHDARGALASLTQLRLYKEAYVLARLRHMGPAAESILKEWAVDSEHTGNIPMAVVCRLVMGDPYKASVELGRSNDQQYLKLASEMAKVVGQHALANHLVDKTIQLQKDAPEPGEPEEDLKPLPKRIELLQIKSNSDEEHE